MSFRLRVTLLAAGAVAVAVVGAAVLMYFVVQTQLVSQFNTTLVEAANAVRSPSGDRSPEGRFPGGPQGTLDLASTDHVRVAWRGARLVIVRPEHS